MTSSPPVFGDDAPDSHTFQLAVWEKDGTRTLLDLQAWDADEASLFQYLRTPRSDTAAHTDAAYQLIAKALRDDDGLPIDYSWQPPQGARKRGDDEPMEDWLADLAEKHPEHPARDPRAADWQQWSSRRRFHDVLMDSDRRVRSDVFVPIADWLVEETVGSVPTSEPQGSSRGRSSGGRGSRGRRRSAA